MRTKGHNTDYKLLHNGVDWLKQVEHSPAQMREEDAIEGRPNKLQRTHSPPSSTNEPPTAYPSRVPEELLAASSEDIALPSANTTGSSSSGQKTKLPTDAPVNTTTSTSAPPTASPSHSHTTTPFLDETFWLSQLDIGDNRPLEGTDSGPEAWFKPQNTTNYGTSLAWQSNIAQSSEPTRADAERIKEVRDALNTGEIAVDQAPNLLRSTHAGLRFQASSALMLAPEDGEAVEMLGGLTMNRESAGLRDASTPEAQPLEMMPGLCGTDGLPWPSTSFDLEQFSLDAELVGRELPEES